MERKHKMSDEIGLKDSLVEKPDDEPIIETAKNFNELYSIVRKIGEIIGSDETRYTADSLIGRINELREGLEKIQKKGEIKKLKVLTQETIKGLIWANKNLKILIYQITRAEKLRSVVVKLAIDEVITKEISRDINDINEEIGQASF